MALDFKEVMDTVKEIDDKIPDEVKDKAKDLLTKENIEKIKDEAEDLFKKD